MDLPDMTLTLLLVTAVLNGAHVGIHVMTTLVRKVSDLPWYDAWVGYLGALAWFAMVIVDRGTLGWAWQMAMPVGLMLTSIGLYIHGRGIRDIMVNGGDGVLVTQGIYLRLRHPIYYGWVAVSFGLPLVTGSWWGLLTAPLWSGLILLIGRMEEWDMRARFPEGEYEEYLRSTWF